MIQSLHTNNMEIKGRTNFVGKFFENGNFQDFRYICQVDQLIQIRSDKTGLDSIRLLEGGLLRNGGVDGRHVLLLLDHGLDGLQDVVSAPIHEVLMNTPEEGQLL